MQCFNEEDYPHCRIERLTFELRPPLTRGSKWESGMKLPIPPILGEVEYRRWDGPDVAENEEVLQDLNDLNDLI
jgi:hypothetical protein